jgi:phosphatidylserine/phosphatidylglycerophosphate/cardiolipin synthase-like enzyme
MTFSFTDEDIADAILFKNVDIKGIFETTQAGSKYSQYQRLKDFGLDVKKDKNKRNMHHKAFIIDRKIVLTGSFNPTGSGNFRNDENIIIIHNKAIADKFLGEFNIVWNLE